MNNLCMTHTNATIGPPKGKALHPRKTLNPKPSDPELLPAQKEWGGGVRVHKGEWGVSVVLRKAGTGTSSKGLKADP